jgi:hypothetical protein
MKVTALVAIDNYEQWRVVGYHSSDQAELEDEAMDWLEGTGRLIWLEAEIPDPVPIPNVQATVVEVKEVGK